MNYKLLLQKYMNQVLEEEGVTFVGYHNYWDLDGNIQPVYSEKEFNALMQIEKIVMINEMPVKFEEVKN